MNRGTILLALALLGYTAFALSGVALVPFHPDESSLLYQSRDLEDYFDGPSSMAWRPDRTMDRELRYRALNPPLPKYLIGLGRLAAGFSAEQVAVDWDWSLDWEANVNRGAMPSQPLLAGARVASTLLLPLSLVLTYLSAREISDESGGALAAILLGSSALFLLHGRRAMMEGALFFGVCLSLWAFLRADRQPWLAGLAVGLAASAKHSLLPLLPVGLMAVWWADKPTGGRSGRLAGLAQYLLAAAALIFLLTPFIWSNPLSAVGTIFEERGSLVGGQIQAQNLADHVAMELPMSTNDRLAAFIGQVFISPAQFEEAANYKANLADQVAAYQRVAAHNWMRGWAIGGLLLGLTLSGAIGAAIELRRLSGQPRRASFLMLLTTGAMTLALLIAVPFPFQRYYLPVLPLVCIWPGHALSKLFALIKRLLSTRAARD